MTLIVTRISNNGTLFVLGKEGDVSVAYQDPGGVWTIGAGLTMGSKVFAAYWLKTRGHALRSGDTLPISEGRSLFQQVMDAEYGPAVAVAIGPTTQWEFDGSASATYNFGLGGLSWDWARALKAGAIARGAQLLRTTATTIAGRPSLGLVARRAAEAKLIETGDYGNGIGAVVPDAHSTSPESVQAYQTDLSSLGYYAGSIDGDAGTLTQGAVQNFQRDNGLVVDGKVGPATRSAMARKLQAKTRNKSMAGASLVSGTASTQAHGIPLDTTLTLVLVAVAAGLVVFIGFTLWNNRGRLTGKRTPV